MTWNCQKNDWPHFRWKSEALAQAEAKFLSQSGILIGATKHFSKDDKDLFVIEHITGEAIKTSEIEGFEGELRAENYIKITGTSRATATRDLQDLV